MSNDTQTPPAVDEPEAEVEAPDVADIKVAEPELSVPDEQHSADYATAIKAIMFPDRFDAAELHVDGVDFCAEEPELAPGYAEFKAGA